MRRHSLTAILAVVALALTTRPATAQEQSYDDVVPSSAVTDEGLFDVHRVDGPGAVL
jgi:hypothetical protein